MKKKKLILTKMSKDDKILVEKISLTMLMELFKDLAESNVEYIDLLISKGDVQDSFGIVVRDEYYKQNTHLSDEDLNKLLEDE